MTIHFICTGNIYRSRLAQAYCASRGVPGIRVVSSGTGTALNGGVPIASYAARMLRTHGLEPFAAPAFAQTTAELVGSSDVLVFMESEHCEFCRDWIDPLRQRIEIWHIPDIGAVGPDEIMPKVEATFAKIREQTDRLLATLGRP